MNEYKIIYSLFVCTQMLSLPSCTNIKQMTQEVTQKSSATSSLYLKKYISCKGPYGMPLFLAVRFFDGSQPIVAAPFVKHLPMATDPTVKKIKLNKGDIILIDEDEGILTTDPDYNFQFGSLVIFSKDVGGGYNPRPIFPFACTYEYNGKFMTLIIGNASRNYSQYIDSIQFIPGTYAVKLRKHPGKPSICDPLAANYFSRKTTNNYVSFHDYLRQYEQELVSHNPYAGLQCLNEDGLTLQRADGYIAKCLEGHYDALQVVSTTKK